ncbi:hypothetical protein R6Q59_019423 [Mikania micrantha]|uniref:LOB domain-containing protein n=1 Tax=Mikania micrantha TaxID=192012 RepID=A0A5N6LXP6_9ASTR|nr:hypothetical protein E3N88_34277 [Mikania micrantha]
MSCNGCRVLRKGCNENCVLRQSLTSIRTAQAQANATLFVAKFFGRAGLLSFLSDVPHNQRPALFQSLLFEACGRTVNPVNGAIGLLSTGNWHLCQSAVATVLRGGTIRAMPELVPTPVTTNSDNASQAINCSKPSEDLQLGLNTTSSDGIHDRRTKKVKRTMISPELSETTTLESDSASSETKLLQLFV